MSLMSLQVDNSWWKSLSSVLLSIVLVPWIVNSVLRFFVCLLALVHLLALQTRVSRFAAYVPFAACRMAVCPQNSMKFN